MKTGWKCPECGRCNAPIVLECPCYKEVGGLGGGAAAKHILNDKKKGQ